MAIEVVYSEKLVSHNIHTHVYDELIYVAQGAVTISIRGRDFHLDGGSLVFLNQFDEHATRILTPVYHRYYLLIPPNQLSALQTDDLLSVFRLHGEHFPYVLQTGAHRDRFDAYFRLLLDTSARPCPYQAKRMEALLTLILSDAAALAPDLFAPPAFSALVPVQAVLRELDQHYAADFSLSALAEKYHVSPGCLSAHFRRQVGMSPMRYVTQSRLTAAKALLLKTDLSVLDISLQCGYKDVSNFVRRFRQQFQMTPLQFRRANRESDSAPLLRPNANPAD